MDEMLCPNLGISAIATYEPPWVLGNDWYGEIVPRKFVHHTGIESRAISSEDEVTMALRVAKNLQREVGCDFQDCAGVIFVSPSFVPVSTAYKHLGAQRAYEERLQVAARQFVRRLGISTRHVAGINWFCSGYTKALSMACRRFLPERKLERDKHLLIVNVSRISRITDYACKQTGALFGDMATATLIARTDSQKYPAHFEIRYAGAEKQPADGKFFNFQLREQVLTPAPDGGKDHAAQKLVFSIDGMGIADAAPRAMSCALAKALAATSTPPQDVRFVVPHQAGSGIVRLTGMKLEELGVQGELINGLTKQIGNVSSCSIPYALKRYWNKLVGTVACPTAAVGAPGRPELLQGCALLRATLLHERIVRAAA